MDLNATVKYVLVQLYISCLIWKQLKHKENTKTLETMLRTVYGFMPKGVKFLYEKK